jgi:hypothetical protein
MQHPSYSKLIQKVKTDYEETVYQNPQLKNRAFWDILRHPSNPCVSAWSDLLKGMCSDINGDIATPVLGVRSDVFGITKNGSKMLAQDAVDAGPEFNLLNDYRSISAHPESQAELMRLGVANSFYKLLRHESYSQLQQLLNTIEQLEGEIKFNQGASDVINSLGVSGAGMQGTLEFDIENGANHIMHSQKLQSVLKELRRIEPLYDAFHS